jgi:hypothetical protein
MIEEKYIDKTEYLRMKREGCQGSKERKRMNKVGAKET